MIDDKPIEDPEDQTPEETEPDEPAAEEPAEEEPAVDEPAVAEEPVEEVDVLDLARMSIDIFVQEAWVGMGVQARPGAADTRIDLRHARIAISMVEAIGGKLADDADDDEQRTIEHLLTDLRVNYLRVSSKSEQQT